MSASIIPTIDRLRQALRGPWPGLLAQMGMAPVPRPGTDRILAPDLHCRRAGVLALLYPGRAETLQAERVGAHAGTSDPSASIAAGSPGNPSPLYIVLTRRTDAVDNHRGQISFPGGSMDPGEDAASSALREAWEELAIAPDELDVLGELSPLYIPPSGFCVYPVVAYAAGRPDFVPNPGEVAEVLEVPLAHLLDPATRGEEVWPIRGANVRVPFYRVGHHKVWGATAMMLCELLMLLRDNLSAASPAE
jgi:8-oxo-dGTP pyrophosphatase MutT (NUDIX family)